MMKRLLFPVLVSTASTVLALGGCGSSTNGGTGSTTPDASTNTQDAGKGSNPDSGSNGDGGANPGDDAGVAPSGTQLVPSSTAAIVFDGLTNDSPQLAIYTDTSAFVVYAVPVTGGTPTKIGTVDDYNDVAIVGNLVFIQSAADSNYYGPLGVWKNGATAPVVLSTMSTLIVGYGTLAFSVSADGSSILLLDNVNETANTEDVIAETADGQTKATLLSGVDISNSAACSPTPVFAGSTAVVAYCPTAAADAGTVAEDSGAATFPALVTAWSGAAWATKTPIETAAQSFLVADSTGKHLLVLTAAGLVLVGPDGTGATTVDATGTGGTFSSDGSTVFYSTTAGALKSFPTAGGGTATALTSTDFSQIAAVSSDNNWAIGVMNFDTNSNGTDLYLSSTSTTGAPHSPTTLSSTTDATLQGAAFTADNSYAAFYTTDSSTQLTSFSVMPTSGSGTATTISANAAGDLGLGEAADLALTGTKMIVAVNPSGGTQSTAGRADLESVDVASPSGATTLVSQADPVFAVTSDKTKVVYSWSVTAGSQAGLWVQSVP